MEKGREDKVDGWESGAETIQSLSEPLYLNHDRWVHAEVAQEKGTSS